jgi:hypothetical protein
MIDLSQVTIPIFIITKDRTSCLIESIQSYYDQISRPIEIVLYDNHSTYEPMLDFLQSYENNGVTVYRNTKEISVPNDLNKISRSIKSYMKNHNAPYYVVTDPDIVLDNTNGDILEFYAHLLENFNINVVGPMLRIDDIPDYYPLKKEAILRHMSQFWLKNPLELTYKGNSYQYQRAYIDTTFGMYRRKYRFRRHTFGIRTYAPYSARHLDWYVDPKKIPNDQMYYMKSSSPFISHWSNIDL